jgi:hypothetical protein
MFALLETRNIGKTGGAMQEPPAIPTLADLGLTKNATIDTCPLALLVLPAAVNMDWILHPSSEGS